MIIVPSEKLLSSFHCPITLEIMEEPVLLVQDGNTYEREAIEKWFSGKKTPYTSPLTKAKFDSYTLVENRAVKNAISDNTEEIKNLLIERQKITAANTRQLQMLEEQKKEIQKQMEQLAARLNNVSNNPNLEATEQDKLIARLGALSASQASLKKARAANTIKAAIGKKLIKKPSTKTHYQPNNQN